MTALLTHLETVAPPTSLRFASVRRALDEVVDDDRSPRAVISGSAGSGKTAALRSLQSQLQASGFDAVILRADTDPRSIPFDTVLLVDDAQALDGPRLDALIERAEEPDASLIVAFRSWPAPPMLTALTRRLEQDRPAILLADATLADVRAELLTTDDACEEHVYRATGGIAWLIHECLAVHDERDCATDPDHHAMTQAVERRIAHRLDTVRTALRRLVEEASVGPVGEGASGGTGGRDEPSRDELIAEGYAEGLLLRNGRPAPLVVSAVRSTVPVHRLVDLVLSHTDEFVRDSHIAECIEGVRDIRLSEAIAQRAREAVSTDPQLAVELFDRAIACGGEPRQMAVGRAYAAWAAGDLDDAGVQLGRLGRDLPAGPERDLVADITAATWAERGLMALADDTYRALPSDDPAAETRERIVAAGAGRRIHALTEAADAAGGALEAGEHVLPSTLGIAMALLDRGLRATLTTDTPTSALADLRRASELYSASRDATPMPELPAVIAAIAAIGMGDLTTAHTIVDDALRSEQGGQHQQPRLQLWRSWLALQRERPAEARAALARAQEGERPLSPRDDAFAAAIGIGIARRYEDSAGLAAAWHAAQTRLLRVEPDLYSLLPLGELVIAAARVGEAASMQSTLDRALEVVARLGDPPLWAAPLHWAGIQRGILLNRPDDLAPHARALVAAAPRHRLAAMMAQAGRVWTAVLAGTVDADAVEAAAHGLATVGLAWDGARLAGHGAGRSEDRKVIARLLACARELHPRETPRAAESPVEAGVPAAPADGILSEREREVAELVVQGKTYAEIGAAIFISPRTAEHHIAHIRRRLDATSRSDLISKLRIVLESSPLGEPSTAREGGRS